jgi:hypothetical protein
MDAILHDDNREKLMDEIESYLYSEINGSDVKSSSKSDQSQIITTEITKKISEIIGQQAPEKLNAIHEELVDILWFYGNQVHPPPYKSLRHCQDMSCIRHIHAKRNSCLVCRHMVIQHVKAVG